MTQELYSCTILKGFFFKTFIDIFSSYEIPFVTFYISEKGIKVYELKEDQTALFDVTFGKRALSNVEFSQPLAIRVDVMKLDKIVRAVKKKDKIEFTVLSDVLRLGVPLSDTASFVNDITYSVPPTKVPKIEEITDEMFADEIKVETKHLRRLKNACEMSKKIELTVQENNALFKSASNETYSAGLLVGKISYKKSHAKYNFESRVILPLSKVAGLTDPTSDGSSPSSATISPPVDQLYPFRFGCKMINKKVVIGNFILYLYEKPSSDKNVTSTKTRCRTERSQTSVPR